MKSTQFLTFILIILFTQTLRAQQTNLSNSLERHVHILASDSLEGRGLGTDGKQKAALYIEQQFTNAGLSPLNGTYRHNFDIMIDLARVKATNIVGIIEGTDSTLKNEYIVLGGHYDHLGYRERNNKKIIYNGADDNASGTASIIELAKILNTKKGNIKRSIILVAFDGEESGLLGSARFLSDNVINPEQIKMMFSIDMVGMYNEYGGVDIKGLGLLLNGINILNQVNTTGVIIKKTGDKKESRTDTKSFLDYNIPSAHVFTGLKSPYHKPEDTAEKLDYDGMAQVCSLIGDLTIALANQPNLDAKPILEKEIKAEPTIDIGLKIAFGSSYLNYKNHDIRGKKSLAFEAGLQTRLKLTNSLFIATDFLYEYNKGKVDNGNLQLHSVTVPIQLMLKTRYQEAYYPRLYATAGMFISSHFANTVNGSEFNPGKIYNDNGICFGIGMDLNQFNFSYDWRISTKAVIKIPDTADMMRNGSKVSIGYRF